MCVERWLWLLLLLLLLLLENALSYKARSAARPTRPKRCVVVNCKRALACKFAGLFRCHLFCMKVFLDLCGEVVDAFWARCDHYVCGVALDDDTLNSV